MKKSVGLLVLGVILLLLQAGCFWGRNDSSEVSVLPTHEQPAGSIPTPELSFRFILPSQQLKAGIAPAILAAGGSASPTVTVNLTLLNFGNVLQPTTVLSKKVPVENGVATITFQNIPSVTAIGDLLIEGGNKAGFATFQGAVDLLSGAPTVMDLAPKGSKLLPDITADVVASLAKSLELFPKLTWGVASRIGSSTFGLDLVADTVYQEVFARLQFALNATAQTTISVTITRPTVAPVAAIRGIHGSILPSTVSTQPVTGAVVKLTLSDGSVITLTDNGNGRYSGTVSNLADASGFFIEAHKGDLIVQNLITDLAGTDLNNIGCDHLTTAFTQVAAAFAKNSSTLQVVTPEDLVKKVTQVSLEFSELRREVMDDTNVKYDLTRKMFQAALFQSDTDSATTTTIIDRLQDGSLKPVIGSQTLSWTDVITQPIEKGDLLAPIGRDPSDSENAVAVAEAYFNLLIDYLGGKTITQERVASMGSLLAESYVNSGALKSNELLQFAQPLKPGEDPIITGFEGTLEPRKLDDLSWQVAPNGILKRLDATDEPLRGYESGLTPDADFAVFSATCLDPEFFFPIIARKFADGKWRLLGNRLKVREAYLQLVFRKYALEQDPAKQVTTGFDLGVRETAAFPIEKVEVTGTNITGTLSLVKDPKLTDSDDWTFFTTDSEGKQVRSWYPGTQAWSSSVVHKNGDKYAFKVTFKDTTTQTFNLELSGLPDNFQALNASVTLQDGQVMLSWDKFSGDLALFDNYEIFVGASGESGDQRILERQIWDVNTTTAQFPLTSSSYSLTSGSWIWIDINAAQTRGIRQAYNSGLQVP